MTGCGWEGGQIPYFFFVGTGQGSQVPQQTGVLFIITQQVQPLFIKHVQQSPQA